MPNIVKYHFKIDMHYDSYRRMGLNDYKAEILSMSKITEKEFNRNSNNLKP